MNQALGGNVDKGRVYKVGLVGAGGVGRKRAAQVNACPRSRLHWVYDVDAAAAAATAEANGARAAADWRAVVDADIDALIVSTTHDALAPVSVAALEAGKHVLCEKPAGRNPAEVRQAVEAAEAGGRVYKAGYNHRYHPAIRKVHRVWREGGIGEIDFIRARYGHGGRPGYDREWRADPDKAGGGEMLDQGVHLIDLCGWFLGDFEQISGWISTRFWDMPLEDNAFGLLRTAGGQVASIHASWTQWKNLFSFEVFGRDGYAVANGLGGSYGPEHAVIGRRRPEGGVPDEARFDFPQEDASWALEWADFVEGMDGGTPLSSGREVLTTIEWVYRLYRASATGAAVDGAEPTT